MFLADYFRKETLKNPVERIAIIKKIDFIGKNSQDWLIFSYKINKKKYDGRVYIADENTEFYKSKIGQKIIVKMNKNNFINKLFLTYRIEPEKKLSN